LTLVLHSSANYDDATRIVLHRDTNG